MDLNHLDFYKEVYYKELDRRNSLNTEVALQGTTLVGIVSGLFFLLTNIKSDHAWVHRVFTWAIAGETLVALVAAYYIMRSYYDFQKKGRRFAYLPKMVDVDGYYRQVKEREFASFLRDSFIAACDSHIEHNDHKSRLLTGASRWMTYLLIGGASITLFFMGNYLFDNPNLKTTSKHADYKSGQPATATARTASPTVAATTSQSASSTTANARVRRARGQDAIHSKVIR